VRVLVAEDERQLAEAIARVFRRLGIATDIVRDGQSALVRATSGDYDVVILDRQLPRLAGDDVCQALAGADTRTKILMLTARDSVDDRVSGLNLGADDYVPKPVAMAELVARVRALARRRGDARPPMLRWRDVELDPARRIVRRSGVALDLARREFAVLEELMSVDGATVSADRLLTSCWDDSHGDPFENTVRVTVMRLRKKLGEPPLIATVVGAGYRMQ
jgi:DNA-binding response OmpR family regulator